MLPKRSTYVKRYDVQTKLMYFFIEDNEFLENCNAIWDKVSADVNLIASLSIIKTISKTKIRYSSAYS